MKRILLIGGEKKTLPDCEVLEAVHGLEGYILLSEWKIDLIVLYWKALYRDDFLSMREKKKELLQVPIVLLGSRRGKREAKHLNIPFVLETDFSSILLSFKS